MNIYSNFTIPGFLYLGMVLFGIWLGIAGKPYNTAIFTVHKLIALAFVVLTIIKLLPFLKETSVTGMLLMLLIIAILCTLGLFAGGAAMSIIEGNNIVLIWLHRILPVALLGTLIGILEILKTTLD
jgi:hypothetical protein